MSAEAAGAAQEPGASAEDPQALLLGSGVGIQQAIDDLNGTLELAARQGLTQARIALAPEELGEIRIHLTQTADGLVARVTASTPAAAQALAAGHAELRQSLSSLGLVRLHTGHPEQAAGGGATAGEHRREDGTAHGEGASHGDGAQPTAAAEASQATPDLETQTDTSASPLPNAALVDVLV